MKALWLLLCIVAVNAYRKHEHLEVVYHWKYFDMLWPSEESKSWAIKTGSYNYTKMNSIDVDRWGGKTFVTIIRDNGVPASLNTVSDKVGPGGPLLKPYPDWSWATKGDCNGITSVYRVAIDECNRLWVLDTGKIGENRVCQAQLLVFDLHNDSLIKRVKIPNNVAMDSKGNGLLVTPIVEILNGNCAAYKVYIADVEGHALITFNGHEFLRYTSDAYAPDPKAEKFTIQGESFDLPDGILGMALSPESRPKKKLWFRPLASYDMNYHKVEDLRQETMSNNVNYHSYKNILPSQAAPLGFSSDGILFFVLTTETALTCWNSRQHLSSNHMAFVAQNPVTLQFASGLKVIKGWGGDEEVWLSTNRLQKVYAGTMNFNEVNFRILKGSVRRLVQGSVCAS